MVERIQPPLTREDPTLWQFTNGPSGRNHHILPSSILLLGFVIGMQHAFEADHLAAVSALVGRERSARHISRHGLLWGVGHSLSLGLLGGLVLLTPWTLPAGFGQLLERMVGGMLIVLGSRLLYRLWRDRVHVHVHEHEGGERHLHAHSHRDERQPHRQSAHQHVHPEDGWQTLLVGAVHGAAGTAALTVLVAANLSSPAAGLFYILLFGFGSICGMAVLSTVIALPLAATAKSLTWANRGLQIAIGCGAMGIGLHLILGG
jgi:ABC-type nickel/cobalt efflux system permease component RcnA